MDYPPSLDGRIWLIMVFLRDLSMFHEEKKIVMQYIKKK